ncbi:MAG: hypothetical protein E3K36_11345 [Candidatus Brocadia sp.]|nr:hypothetical protein [Candidatus Brocadia sp.]
MQNTGNNTSNTNTLTFNEVKDAEKEEIKRSRKKRLSEGNNSGEELLVGLAFSGGGIRSATFNLGVLQGLAELGILPIFDYLSTVSGGGYIGSWLVAWIKNKGRQTVIDNLHPDWSKHNNKKEPEKIHHLRDYSNYLTPRKGLLGTDTWLLLTTYLRNSFFNLLILVSVLFSIITFIHFILISSYHPSSPFHDYVEIACWVIPFIFIIICISFLCGSMERKWLPFVLIIVALFLSYGLWKGYYIDSIDCWKLASALFLLLSFLWSLFRITISEKHIGKIFIKIFFLCLRDSLLVDYSFSYHAGYRKEISP